MSEPTKSLPAYPDLEQYKTQAKELVKAVRVRDRAAAERVRGYLPRCANSTLDDILTQSIALADAQLVLAREHGFATWADFKHRIEQVRLALGPLAEPIEQFREAVRGRDVTHVRELLKAHEPVRAAIDAPLFSFGAPAVVEARDDRAVLDALLEFGADINAQSNWEHGSHGVLHGASPETAEYLLSRGAMADIHALCELGDAAKVREAIAQDSDLVHRRGPDGKLPLHCAKTPEIVDVLLDAGADINGRDLDHVSTAVQYAARNPDVCRRLVERGADADVFIGAVLGDIALLERALERNPETLHAHTPCMLDEQSAESGYPYPEVPENSAHVYAWTIGFGWSPAFAAYQCNQPEAMEWLLARLEPTIRLAEACARLDETAVDGIHAAHPGLDLTLSENQADLIAGRSLYLRSWSVPGRVVQVLELVLRAGFDVNMRCRMGSTPLQWAAWLGHADAVRLLLDAGAAIDVESRAVGGTPLSWTLNGRFSGHPDYDGYLDVVDALLAAGSKVNPAWLPTKDPEINARLEPHATG